MGLKQLKYVELDDEIGRLYAAGSPHLLVPVGIVASIRGVLKRIAGDAASEALIYRVGEDIGRDYANRVKKLLLEGGVELDKDALLEQVYYTVMQSGWGTIEIEWINPEENIITIRGSNLPCQELEGCVCALERGILAGAYHVIIGMRIYYALAENAEGVVVFDSQREIPAEVLREEELSLLSKSELEGVIKEKIVEIARSNERFEQIARSSGDWIWEVDSDGRYTYTSPAVTKILGYTTEEILGMHFYDLYDSDRPKEGAMEVFRRKEPFISHININRHRDGHTAMLETTGVPVLDCDGELLGYRGVDRDVTEQKNLEQRLHQTIDKLKESYEELSIPVIQAWDGVLVLPIIGVLDSERINRLMEAMLARIVETHSGTVILDITGVRSVDTNVANNLIDVTRSARLLGATCVITGIKPEAAHSLVGLGVDMSKMITKRTLQEGLAYALKVVGRG